MIIPICLVGGTVAAALLMLHASVAEGRVMSNRFGSGSGPASPPPVIAAEEFVGPFPSWGNAKTSWGAIGNGSVDDTTALQNCINGISSTSPVCYLPAGTYRITSTLNVSSNMAVCTAGSCLYSAIIGHDPADTRILWAGPANGTMMLINGVNGGSFNRLTFDGGGTARVLIDQAWDGTNTGGRTSDTGNQYVDNIFTNSSPTNSYGYRCGVLGIQCSEIGIIRNTFDGTSYGVSVCNANALDVWIWHSKFIANDLAVTNNTNHIDGSGCGSGNYQIAGSIFQNSSIADIWSQHGGQFNVIDSFSSGSNQFANHGDQLTIQRTTILDTTLGVSLGACTYVALLDNKVKTKAGNAAPVVSSIISGCGGGRLLSVGNTYTVNGAEQNYDAFFQNANVVDLSGASIDPTPPTLPGTPPNNGRTIFETSPSGVSTGPTCTAAAPCPVQTAICLAATGSNGFAGGNCTGSVTVGTRNVVHIKAGNYTVATPISVPANSDIQIIGDTWHSRLAGNAGVNPVLKINGPTKVTLRDFQVDAQPAGGVDAILIAGIDQVGAMVYIEGSKLAGNNSAAGSRALFMDALSNVLVETHNLDFPYLTTHALQQTGPARLNVFFGGSTAPGTPLGALSSVSGGAQTTIIGVWEDQSGTPAAGVISATGSGDFVYSTANFNNDFGPPSAVFNNYTGKAALINLRIPRGNVNLTGSGTAANHVIALTANPTTPWFSNTATGSPTIEFFGNDGQANSPTTPDMNIVASSLNKLRTVKPSFLSVAPAGITQMGIYHVFVGVSSGTAVHLTN
jgi:hypothetical protein